MGKYAGDIDPRVSEFLMYLTAAGYSLALILVVVGLAKLVGVI